MNEDEFKVFSFIKDHPNVSIVKVGYSLSKDIEVLTVYKLLDALEYRGLIYKTVLEEDWEQYKATEWAKIELEEKEGNALRFICLKYKEFGKRFFKPNDLLGAFHNELSEREIDGILQQLIIKGMVVPPSAKGDGKDFVKVEIDINGCESYNRRSPKEDVFLQLVLDQSTHNSQQITGSKIGGSISQTGDSSNAKNIKPRNNSKSYWKEILIGVIIGVIVLVISLILNFFKILPQ